MKIAITGGNGFIGARLAKALTAAGHRVVPIDTTGETPVDIMDKEALTNAVQGCEAIYHLAAAHRDDIFPRSLYYDINGQGTKNVIDAANAAGITKIIFTSSFAVYGLDSGTPDETTTPAPFNDYGRSKLEAEQHLKLWAKASSERRLTIVRPVVVFGEGNRGNMHTLIDQIARGRFLMIGQGQNKKSIAYVGNVVDFLVHTLGGEANFVLYNYADKPDLSTRDLIDIICRRLRIKPPSLRLPYMLGLAGGYVFDGMARVTGKRFPISAVRVQKFCADTTCAADACRAAGFTPRYTLEDGIIRMIDADFSPAVQKKTA